MSDIVDAMEAEYFQYGNNPEGFPCCPRCGKFVELVLCLESYYCSGCNYTIPIERISK
jgi:hypothetical protein